MITDFHIFDFDGTLVDSSHRYRLNEHGRIDLAHWIENEHKATEDKPLPLFGLFQRFSESRQHYTTIATARIWCDASRQWAADHNMPKHVPIIARRGRDDARGGAALKIAGVNRILNLRQFANVNTIHVWEDNADYLDTIANAYADRYSVARHFIPSAQGY